VALNSPRIVYRAKDDVRPEGELNALSAIYQRAIERYDERKEGGATTATNDAMKRSKHEHATPVLLK